VKYYDRITWEGKELHWFPGHLSDGGYVVHLLGYYPEDQDEFLDYSGPRIVGAATVQECASCQAELPLAITPGLEWVVVEGREPMGTVVAGPFINEANPREAEREAGKMASVKWHEWAARVGRNCTKCGYVPEYCTCPK
jgi:hypothetical protein